MLRNQEKSKDNWHHRIHTKTKVEMGRTCSKNEVHLVDQKGEGIDQEDDQEEDDKTI